MSSQKKRSFRSTGNRVETPDNVYSSLAFSSVRADSPLEMLVKKDKMKRGETQPSALSNYKDFKSNEKSARLALEQLVNAHIDNKLRNKIIH